MYYHNHILRSISPEALAMLINYTLVGTTLVGIERSSMITYVDKEVSKGTHAKKNYETIYSLFGINSLVDYIGGILATAVNAPIHNINGYTFDGATNQINSNFIPSLSTKISLKNALYESFLYQNNEIGTNNKALFGGQDAGAAGSTRISQHTTELRGFFHQATLQGPNNIFLNKTLYSVRLDNPSNQIFIREGLNDFLTPQVPFLVPSRQISIGSLNADGVNIWHANLTASHFMVAEAIDFDVVNHRLNLRNLLTNLGVVL